VEFILGTLITAVGGVIVALIQRSRKENRTDHAMVVSGLKRIETKIDTHINDHAVGKFDPGDDVVVVVPESTMTATKKPRAPRKTAASKPAAAPKKKAS
jgi:hypothetical protein